MSLINRLKPEITLTFSRSGGPGGQNVNKVSTKVTLRFNLVESLVLSETQKEKLINSGLRRYLTKNNEVIIHSDSARSRDLNIQDVLKKFEQEISQGLKVKKKRVPTKPSKASLLKKERAKRKRSLTKNSRKSVLGD